MSALLFWVGNRNPSISERIESGGALVDLTGKTVKFKAREVGSDALLVDASATPLTPATDDDPNVRYDWTAEDIADGGILASPRLCLIWWEVTTTSGGNTQDMSEALIEIRAHTSDHLYVELEQFKNSLSLTNQNFADVDAQAALLAASRGIDGATGRRFWLDDDNTSVRYYTPEGARLLLIDDVVDVAAVDIDRSGNGSFSESWTEGTDFVMEPFNAAAEGWPQDQLRARRLAGRWFPCEIERSVRVTGQFGWPSVPGPITVATGILAHKLIRRVREAPFGVLTVGVVGVDSPTAIHIARTDPDVANLIGEYSRQRPFF